MSSAPKLLLDWFDFVCWLFQKTANFPKRFRSSLTTRIESNALLVLEILSTAQYTKAPTRLLHNASDGLDRLRILLRLAHRLRALDNRAYEHAAERITEPGRMLGGWLRQLEGEPGAP